MSQEGETIRTEQITDENRQLRDVIKNLTVELEQKKRESQIELSLEKVRARTMAMQQSDELQDAAMLLFREVQVLGVLQFVCGFNIWDEDKKSATAWMAREDGIEPRFKTSSKEDIYIQILDAALRGESLFVREQGGDELEVHYSYLTSIPEVKIMSEAMAKVGISWPSFQIMHCAFFSQGYLMFITYEPVPEAYAIFIRFANVFEQTYTRFLDLQKAEAQTREAQIEAALERVRSKAMAMQKSDDLANAVAIVFDELEKMNLGIIRCGISIINKEKHTTCIWSTTKTDEGTVVQVSGDESMDIHPLLEGAFSAWLQQEDYSYVLTGDDQQNFYSALTQTNFHLPDYQNDLQNTEQHMYVAHVSVGGLYVFKGGEFSEDIKKVIRRFAAVFNLTYTRFNDLQIAEAYAIQAEQDLIQLKAAKKRAENALTKLKATQAQLIQAEKMASLGELTAGIAHEIQNPLNFVNNFSEVSKELVVEMKIELDAGNTEEALDIANDLIQNLEKITHHGQRASVIVKGMLQHSRSSSGQKEPTDINALTDEYIRLSYQGFRAKDNSFSATIKTDFDPTIGKTQMISQDIGRVILNLLNNAFYAVQHRQREASQPDYAPTVIITTQKVGARVLLRIKDNGDGIPESVRPKVFQPFFTTKPTGEGTGLGLSLSYDIVTKGHGGTLQVESKEGEGSVFTITLPG